MTIPTCPTRDGNVKGFAGLNSWSHTPRVRLGVHEHSCRTAKACQNDPKDATEVLQRAHDGHVTTRLQAEELVRNQRSTFSSVLAMQQATGAQKVLLVLDYTTNWYCRFKGAKVGDFQIKVSHLLSFSDISIVQPPLFLGPFPSGSRSLNLMRSSHPKDR